MFSLPVSPLSSRRQRGRCARDRAVDSVFLVLLVNPTVELRNANGALLTSNDNYYYDYYVATLHLVPRK